MDRLFKQIRDYAEHFPFVGYTDDSINAIQTRLGANLPTLLTHCFRFIGEGHLELTGGFFYCDVDGACTEMLRRELRAAATPSQYSEDFGFVEQPEWESILYIGGRDFFFNFIELNGVDDPVVHTCFEGQGLHCENEVLSCVVQSFKAMSDPKRVPQSMIDVHWFEKMEFLYERPSALESQAEYVSRRESAFLKWKQLDRPGLPEKYRNMAVDDAVLYEGKILLNY